MIMIMVFLHLFLLFLIINVMVSVVAIDDMGRNVVVQESRYYLYSNNTDKE
jgi:cell division protein FtsL